MDYMEDDYGDQYDNEDDFTEEDWEVIDSLCQVADVSKDKAISAYDNAEGNFDKALQWIQADKKKEEDKKARKEKEEKEKAEKARIRAEEKAAKDKELAEKRKK